MHGEWYADPVHNSVGKSSKLSFTTKLHSKFLCILRLSFLFCAGTSIL